MTQGIRSKLIIGNTAPQFAVDDVTRTRFELAEQDDEYVLLTFLRYSGCPWCNLAIHRLTIEQPMLAKNGCRVVVVVQSSVQNIQQNIYARQQAPPQYPIIADSDRKIYDLYGVQPSLSAAAASVLQIPHWLESAFGHGYTQTEVDGNLLMVPATFLISPGDQKIVKAKYGSSFYDHTTFTDIYEDLTFGPDIRRHRV
jgi:peroxiredoxin